MTSELKAQIERIKALLPKITAGEWSDSPGDDGDPACVRDERTFHVTVAFNDTPEHEANQEFIALARNAMPAILEEMERERIDHHKTIDAAEKAADMIDELRTALLAELARYRQQPRGATAKELLDAIDSKPGLTLDLGELKEGERG